MKILSREDIKNILKLKDVAEEVTKAYKLKAQNKTVLWPLIEQEFIKKNAVMDIRSGYVKDIEVHGFKVLNDFPFNHELNLPTFTGLLTLFDSTTGLPLGMLDASFITSMRTGMAAAIGAKSLSRKDSTSLLILGAGKQSPFLIAASMYLMPQLNTVYISDPLSFSNSEALSKNLPHILFNDFGLSSDNVKFVPVESLEDSLKESDIVLTITPSKLPLIQKEWVKKGTHFSCIGADMKGKEEIDPQIFVGAKIYTDDTKQCMEVGELEIPITSGIISKSNIQGELDSLLINEINGRTSEDEITIFDATGLAILDIVVGKLAIEIAQQEKIGQEIHIF